MKKAILFDMDGLMIDSERVIYEIYQDVMKDFGYTYSKELCIASAGMARKDEMDLYYKEYGEDFPEEVFWNTSRTLLDQRLKERLPMKEGLVELLTYLKENHYKMIVASSSERSRVDQILQTGNLTDYFDDVICGDEVKNSKPDPEIFLTACKKLDVDVKDALVLEDSEHGIMAAYNASIDVICIPDMKYPSEEYAKKTVCILPSLFDVIAFLQGE